MRKFWVLVVSLMVVLASCSEDDEPKQDLDSDLRYFKFRACDHTDDWRNESFIASTADPGVIQQCLDQLALPAEERTLFPLGKITAGSGGYNFNDTHEFNWHFIEDEWELVEMGIEIYDGCPYSEAELLDYAGTVGSYGGWGNRIEAEVVLN
ncbi:hypothetical protein [Fulvivirga lutimaris]|uniref:BP74-related protein n=1 Tax=Fulvivirga lutimaris TaxID=1819566 RepID=UPI0012BCD1F8|nr:hypothetical protein [Fulvivirga lutimaris]MTI38207.1 hypothetical protein [Fulvivirga lutimaris]